MRGAVLVVDFRAEIEAFEAALPSLLKAHGGEYVIIRGTDVAPQTFRTYEEALGWGYDHFGLERFFVKQIADRSHATHFMRGFAE